MKMKFFSPTNTLKELLLLEHIEKKPQTTQGEIAEIIDGARSMVNVYIKESEEKGYLEREYESSKIVNYNITRKGIKRKNFLSIVYLQELMKLYKIAEENVEDFLDRLEDKGYKEVLLYGAGEVAEVLLSVIKKHSDRELKIVGIIDDNIDKESLNEYKILKRENISRTKHDGIIITSYTYEDHISERLRDIEYPEEKIERFFSE